MFVGHFAVALATKEAPRLSLPLLFAAVIAIPLILGWAWFVDRRRPGNAARVQPDPP